MTSRRPSSRLAATMRASHSSSGSRLKRSIFRAADIAHLTGSISQGMPAAILPDALPETRRPSGFVHREQRLIRAIDDRVVVVGGDGHHAVTVARGGQTEGLAGGLSAIADGGRAGVAGRPRDLAGDLLREAAAVV